jgi:hypothetical protein
LLFKVRQALGPIRLIGDIVNHLYKHGALLSDYEA